MERGGGEVVVQIGGRGRRDGIFAIGRWASISAAEERSQRSTCVYLRLGFGSELEACAEVKGAFISPVVTQHHLMQEAEVQLVALRTESTTG